MIEIPQLRPEFLVQRLTPPTGEVSIVLDTDTYNEMDDQYALAYAVLAEDIDIEAVYAAPFHNARSASPEDGMEKSYAEIQRILGHIEKMGCPVPSAVFKGSKTYQSAPDKPVASDAAQDLVERALSSREGVLYVVAIGAITNISSAILMNPEIRNHIVVVWLGGQPYTWHTARDFNLEQDLFASKFLFDSGVPLVHIPCKNVAEHLKTTIHELGFHLKDKNDLCNFLLKRAEECLAERGSLSKVIWDISAIAWLRDPNLVPTALTPAPILTSEFTWSMDPYRHLVRVVREVRRDDIYRDLFRVLTGQ
jgi:inosine-uridine nucleoside N-ribohydrolase